MHIRRDSVLVCCALVTLLTGLSAHAQAFGSNARLLEGQGKKTILVDIEQNGDCQRDESIQFSLKDYSLLKRRFPNSYFFLQRYSSLQADFEIDEHLSEYVDASSSVHLKFRMLGFAKTLGRSRWMVPIDEKQQLVTSSRDPESGREVYHFVTPKEDYRGIELTVQSKYKLPQGAINSRFNRARRQLEYELPHEYTAEGSDLQLINLYAKTRIVTASYKTYGLGKGVSRFMASQWIGKVVLRNEGTGILNGLRVRFKLTGGYSDWSPSETVKEVYPGQTVVLTYYPVLNSNTADLQADAPSDVICEYTYEGTTYEESDRVRLLSKNSFVFSHLLAGERFGTWHEDHANAPFLSAWVSSNDPVINMFAAMANKAAGGIGAKSNDNAAIQVLSKCYEMLVVNDVTYQHPHGLLDTSVSFDPRSIQSIKYPRDVLRDKSGTCVDLAILYASMANSLGLRPYLMLVPGHCFPVVQLPSGQMLPIETTLVAGGLRYGVGTFDSAARVGAENLQSARQDGRYVLIDVQSWWKSGISNPELRHLPEDILDQWNLRPIEAPVNPDNAQTVQVQNQDNLSISIAVPRGARLKHTIRFRNGTSVATVRSKAINSMTARGWKVIEQTESLVTATLDRGKYHAKVYVTFSPDQSQIYSDSTIDDGRGGRMPYDPERWINYMKSDIAAAAGL